jgi:hypothetical protein
MTKIGWEVKAHFEEITTSNLRYDMNDAKVEYEAVVQLGL